MQRLHEHVSAKETPQTEPIPGSGQVPNSAGGHAWAVDRWERLKRFLILGTEGGTYYIQEKPLTQENAKAVLECLDEDGDRAVELIASISSAGRAPKNDPALFALAMAAGSKSASTRKAALAALPKVARVGTHLFHFAEYVQAFRGWGRALRRAVGDWYLSPSVNDLAYQAVKYRQRDGWSHRDLLRLSHPETKDAERRSVFEWIVKGKTEGAPGLIAGFEAIQASESAKEAARLVEIHNLPRECVPDRHLGSPSVWEALLQRMPVAAMVRNLGKMSAVGLVKPFSEANKSIATTLNDAERIRKSRIHPIQILLALRTYQSGKGFKGSLSWTVSADVCHALETAFHLAFENVEPVGKRFLLGVDVSGSMCSAMASGLTCREAASAMSLVTVKTEPQTHCMAFQSQFSPLPFHKGTTLAEANRYTAGLPFGGTDCALPMLYALQAKIPVDVFVVYTDNETWAGSIHPAQALKAYRDKMGIPAKLCVMAFASNGFTIADPNDSGMLDVVGFDASVPAILHEFSV